MATSKYLNSCQNGWE
uniref:Uncharacterized protein n=1 Tax=Rhizophora mucronata TaxID=61149 RepID=A0A2P2QFN2_RHIMU